MPEPDPDDREPRGVDRHRAGLERPAPRHRGQLPQRPPGLVPRHRRRLGPVPRSPPSASRKPRCPAATRKDTERTPAAAWTSELPPTPDFLSRRFEITPPGRNSPPPGSISSSPATGPTSPTTTTPFRWPRSGSATSRSSCVPAPACSKASSSTPAPGSRCPAPPSTPWNSTTRASACRWAARRPTNSARSSFPDRRAERPYLLRARKGGQQVAMAQDLWWMRAPEPGTRWQETLLFTDRSLYRPGQLVQYKGICIRHDDDAASYSLLPGQRVVGRLPRHQRQGDRPPGTHGQRLRIRLRLLHCPPRSGHGFHDPPRRGPDPWPHRHPGRGVQAPEVPGHPRRPEDRPPPG